MLPAFDYHPAGSLAEAVDLLGQYGDDAHLVAGGTALMLLLKQGLIQPAHVVGLRGVPELRGIREAADGGLEIGALTTHREAERSTAVQRYCPALAETFSRVATVRIRNQATVGGNLVHADPAQDPPPMLMALGAEVVLAGPNGQRVLPLDEFFVDFFESAIQPSEVLVSVRLPALLARTKATYVKFLPRTEDDYATVSVAAVATPGRNGSGGDVRIALGSAATVPLRARRAEAALAGVPLKPERIREAATLVREEVDPLDDVRGSAGYKREMARVWTERALLSLAEGVTA